VKNPAADFNMDNKIVPMGTWLTIPQGVEIVDEPDIFKYKSFPDEPAEFESREEELIAVGNKLAQAATNFKRAVTKARLNEISEAKGELSKAINEWNKLVGGTK
jgi:hypothetical protein